MNEAQMQELAHQVAEFLPGWRYDRRNKYKHNAYFIGPNSERFFITKDRTRGKLKVMPCFHDIYSKVNNYNGRISDYDCVRKSNFGSIGVSSSRTAQSIAQDVQRRFIPEFIVMFQLAEKERQSNIAKSNELINRVNLLKKISPALHDASNYRLNKHQVNYRHELRGNIHTKGNISVSVKVELFRNHPINMDLHGLTDEQAIKILSLLNEASPPAGQ